MKRLITLFSLLITFSLVAGQTVPEILYYKFDGSGTTVPNDASSPPAGTITATIVGSLTQGSSGMVGGALVGTGGSSSSNYLNTNWATNLGTGPWTIMFWTDDLPSSTTLFYNWGDNNAGGFRCFTNGVASAGNWIMRGGGLTDVLCTGCAPINTPSMTSYVYDPVAGNVKAYHNGTLNNTVSQPALNITGAGPFKVGGYSGSTGLASGEELDEFRIYNRALDATEIALVYNQTLPLSFSPNDAAITQIEEPANFCADTLDIVVNLKNAGTAQMTSCNINWTFDGVLQTPIAYAGLLDTLGGTGADDTSIVIGTKYFAANTPYDIVVWSTLPNGVADTVNYNDTASVTVQAAISGTFQIGGAGADYAGFSDAVNDLNAYGVCGPVVFNVYDSTFTEQIDLTAIDGASSVNTITFQPLSGTPEVLWPAFQSASNYVVGMAGADWVTFSGLYFRNDAPTYGRVLQVGGGAHNNTFEDCWFVGDTTPTSTSTNHCVVYSNTDLDTNNVFRGNTFRGGSYGVYWYGANTTTLESGTVFEDNDFVDNYYYGARLYYQDGPKFTWNDFIGNTNYTGSVWRFYFLYCDNDLVVANNTTTGDYYGYGIYVGNCDGTVAQHGKIYNNMIRVGNSATTSTTYGMYFTNNGYQDIYHNSVNVTSAGTFSRACYVTAGGGNTLRNNNFVNMGAGYAMYLLSQYSLVSSDHNNFYAPNGKLAYFNVDQLDLTSWTAASGYDANSVNVNPMYYSDDDLHVCQDTLNGAGEEGWGMWDIDGQVRDASAPDIGADEFQPIGSFSLGADFALCTGDTVWIESYASPSDTVLWNTGATTSGIWVTAAGTYSVSVNGPCGSASDAITVTTSNLTYANFLMSDTNDVCDGDTVWLSSNMSADSYSWTGGSTDSTLMVTTSGTYDLTITDGCGAGTESVTINFNSAPVADFSHSSSFLTGIFTFTGSASGTTTYAWDFGDATGTSSLQDPIYLYGADGSYLVSLTVTNECGTSTYSDTIFVTSVGMEEDLLNSSVGIYPNPSNGNFNVDLNLTGTNEYRITVIDLQGRALMSTDLETISGKAVKELTLDNATSGIYFVQIEVNDHRVVKKLVIE